MAQTVGQFRFASPTVKFKLGGSKLRLEFDGLIDTGFTGFILLPIALAVPLGVELDGLNISVTADGTYNQWPTATATIEFGAHTKEGSIVLAYTGDEILLGMSFLETFKQSLIIHRDQVLLQDHATLDPILPGLH